MPDQRKPIALTAPALNDLQAIWEFVGTGSEESASRVVAAIQDLMNEKIRTFPEGFPLYPVFGKSDVRMAHYRSWLVLYRVRPQSIQVLRVVHGGRDLRRIHLSGE